MSIANQVVKLSDLTPHPRNYNRHGEAQVARIAKSLSTFGQVRSIVVWRMTTLAGHGVVEAAASIGWDSLRADVLPDEYPEEKALAYVVADNELARQSDPDQEQLAALLQEIAASETVALEAVGYSQTELEQLLRLVGANSTGDGGSGVTPEQARATLSDRFLVPPFSVLDARQGYWQERKRAWLALGIQSELGRGEAPAGGSAWPDSQIGHDGQNARRDLHMNAAPGGSQRPAARLGKDGKTVRGDGRGKPLNSHPTNTIDEQGGLKIDADRRQSGQRKPRGSGNDMAMHDSANFPTPLARKRSYDRKSKA